MTEAWLRQNRVLQFGHGGEAVENLEVVAVEHRCLKSFNSATAVKPWRTVPGIASRDSQLRLQFGHGGEAVENEE